MNHLLDSIHTNTDVYRGVVDFTNRKHLVLFDLTNNNSPDIVLLVISWRSTYENEMRFSVFRDIFFPHIDVPVVLIPRKDIVNDYPMVDRVKPKKKKIVKK